jgi:hypothetical protein
MKTKHTYWTSIAIQRLRTARYKKLGPIKFRTATCWYYWRQVPVAFSCMIMYQVSPIICQLLERGRGQSHGHDTVSVFPYKINRIKSTLTRRNKADFHSLMTSIQHHMFKPRYSTINTLYISSPVLRMWSESSSHLENTTRTLYLAQKTQLCSEQV